MTQHELFLRIFISLITICYVQSTDTKLLRNSSTLVPPCSACKLVEVLPKNSNIVVFFHDRYADGSYVYGYILCTGERRYELGTRYAGLLYVDGFYSNRKMVNSKYVYETTWYVAGKYGYYPSKIEVTNDPPKIPTVDYFPNGNKEEAKEKET